MRGVRLDGQLGIGYFKNLLSMINCFFHQMKLIATNFCVVFVIMVCFYAGPPPAMGKQYYTWKHNHLTCLQDGPSPRGSTSHLIRSWWSTSRAWGVMGRATPRTSWVSIFMLYLYTIIFHTNSAKLRHRYLNHLYICSIMHGCIISMYIMHYA